MPSLSESQGALGILAAVIGWIMLALNRRLDTLTARFETRIDVMDANLTQTNRSLNALARGLLIEVLTRRDVPKEVEVAAKRELRDLGVDL